MKTEYERVQIDFHKHADHRRFHNRLQNEFIRHREVRLARMISQAFGEGIKRVLEVGCGEGSNYAYLNDAMRSLDYTGVDFSFSKTLFLSQMFSRVTAVQADALALPFPDKSFDGVLCRDLLHHVSRDRVRAIAEAVRVTRSGGTILIIEANGRTLLNRIFRLLFRAERGMADSAAESLVILCGQWGYVELRFVEASQLSRAVAFFLGWPKRMRPVVTTVYWACDQIERIASRVLPEGRWAYYMVAIRVA